MKPRVMAELLSQYVDRIGTGRDDTGAYLSLFHSHRNELAPLFSVIKLLRTVFVRTEPSPAFVETLGMDLRLAAQQAAMERREKRGWQPTASRRNLVLGAAALGSLAWLAAIVVIGRSRATARTRTAA